MCEETRTIVSVAQNRRTGRGHGCKGPCVADANPTRGEFLHGCYLCSVYKKKRGGAWSLSNLQPSRADYEGFDHIDPALWTAWCPVAFPTNLAFNDLVAANVSCSPVC